MDLIGGRAPQLFQTVGLFGAVGAAGAHVGSAHTILVAGDPTAVRSSLAQVVRPPVPPRRSAP